MSKTQLPLPSPWTCTLLSGRRAPCLPRELLEGARVQLLRLRGGRGQEGRLGLAGRAPRVARIERVGLRGQPPAQQQHLRARDSMGLGLGPAAAPAGRAPAAEAGQC